MKRVRRGTTKSATRRGTPVFYSFEYQFIGGHTVDSGVFYFCNGGKKFCLAGDECFSLDYVEHNRPIDNAFNLEQNIKFTEQCFREKIIVLPSHDEEIMKRYMNVSENLVKII